MKKIIAASLATTLVLALGATALAAESNSSFHPNQMGGQMQMEHQAQPELNEEKLAELEALAEEAGLTLEEYMATLTPEQGEKPEMGEGRQQTVGGKEEGMSHETLTEEELAEKQAEQEAMKAEKQAELEALAEEAGLTLEEYMATLTPEQGEKPEMGGMNQAGQQSQGGQIQGGKR